MPEAVITKKALAEALRALMRQKPFEKVSIGEICDQCGMNRRSFYYHFQDKYDLVIWIFDSEFLDYMYEKDYSSIWHFLRDICDYFYAHREFYLDILAVSGQNSFREHYREIFTPLLTEVFSQIFDKEEHRGFLAEFYADAFLLSLEKWLRRDNMTPEEFADVLRRGIEGTGSAIAPPEEAPPRASPPAGRESPTGNR